MKVQSEVVALIKKRIEKEDPGIKQSHKEALKQMKSYVAKAIGKPYVKASDGGDIKWIDALIITKKYLTK